MTPPGRDRLAILVHEVRSPVAALTAIAEACAADRLDTSARRPLVELAVAACRGIERLVGDAALASVRLERVDVGHLVDEVVATAMLEGKNVRAEVDADLPSLQVDPLRLRQALDNLVSNAFRHTGSAAEVIVSARRGDGVVLVSVADTGPGVPLADQARIFEAGVQLSRGGSGSGLGLTVARAIAEAHGGTLTVESVPERGARFTVALAVT